MAALKDLIGKRFGKLVVIKRAGSSHGFATWLCKCDCGSEIIILSNSLNTKKTKSCGCISKLPEGEAGFRHILRSYKKNAKQRGFSFNLPDDYVKEIMKQDCHYCGKKPSQKARRNDYKIPSDFLYNGLDRKDNNKGYTKENTVPCCKDCNIAKHTMSYESFLNWISKVYNNLKLK